MNGTAGARTPQLDALLGRLRGRIVRMVWLHGTGSVLIVAAVWLVIAFLIDWLLHVPAPVRLFHLLLLVALPLGAALRELFGRLVRVPDASGLAILAERADPRAEELLVSAVELSGALALPRQPEHELIERVLVRAEARANDIRPAAVVLARAPLRRFLLGASCALFAAVVLGASPALSAIFFQRLLGRAVAWPQRTHLALEIPSVNEQIQVEDLGERIHVRLARGSDLAVVVRAHGVVPDEVVLHFSTGHTSVLSSGGNALFRTGLRSLQEDARFWVTGGDDERGLPVVELEVLEPPDVAGTAVTVTPPAYTGLPQTTTFDRDVEALRGSLISVHVLPDPPSARGIVRLLPADRVVELQAAPFPSQEVTPEQSQPEQRAGLSFTLVAEESLRYRFELTDETGLSNPDPGLFGIQVIEDRRPEITLLSPARAEVNVVASGALALRARIADDFGIALLRWSVRSSEGEEPIAGGELEALPVATAEEVVSATRIGRQRLEIAAFGNGAPLTEGSQVLLQIEATDTREPEPNVALSPPVRLRVVGADEFMRRLQDDLARIGEQVRRTNDLLEEKTRRTRELLAVLASDEIEGLEAGEIEAVLAGARRVQGDTRSIGRDLAGVAEGLLYSRLDERSGALLDALDASLANLTDKSFEPEPWRELARRQAAGELGSAELAAQLVTMVGLGLEVSEEHAAAATASLELAREADGSATLREALAEAEVHQRTAKDRLEELLGKLAEWDNFQSVLSNLRDIVNSQKNLLERTRQFAKDH